MVDGVSHLLGLTVGSAKGINRNRTRLGVVSLMNPYTVSWLLVHLAGEAAIEQQSRQRQEKQKIDNGGLVEEYSAVSMFKFMKTV